MTTAEAIAGREVIWQPHEGPQTDFLTRLEDIVLYGGSKGPGKTDALLMEVTRQIDNPNYHALIVRRTYPKLQECIDRAHKIYSRINGTWNADLKRYYFPSGAFIEFGHCEHEFDKERYQGHEYVVIGFDQLEEFLESQFNFIMAQNRTTDPTLRCYIRATANPGSVGHWWVKRRFIEGREIGKTYTQTFDLANGQKVTRTQCFIRATIYDNPTLMKANPTYLANLMSLPEAEKKAFLEGDWNVFSSQCVFDPTGMQMQESWVEAPRITGYLQPAKETYQVVPDVNGNLKVWETPRVGDRYMISADVAEGDAAGDYSSAHVINRMTWEVDAHWHGQIDPLEFGDILFSLGQFYNLAEIAPEVNGPGIATVSRLKEREYPSIFSEDEKPGFRTDIRSRHNMIATLLEAVKDKSARIRDRVTVDEMYNFIRNPVTQKMEARESCHDDCVMSLAIGLHCIRINPMFRPPVQRGGVSRIGLSHLRPADAPRRSPTGYR